MFCGIVTGVGTILNRSENAEVTTLTITLPSGHGDGLVIGASVAVDGVCLTTTEVDNDVAKFDLIAETLVRTTLSSSIAGGKVNIERAMKFGDEIGGHILSGHVIATAEITTKELGDEAANYALQAPAEIAQYIHEKGFIAIDGISLTIGKVDGEGGFNIHLIPETLRLTTLGSKAIGDSVNIEVDSMTQAVVETVKRVERLKNLQTGQEVRK